MSPLELHLDQIERFFVQWAGQPRERSGDIGSRFASTVSMSSNGFAKSGHSRRRDGNAAAYDPRINLWMITMYTLYYSPGSANMLVHLILLECGAPYTLERVDLDAGEQRSAAYLALNPNGVVPTLVINGVPHGEAAALAMLLLERHADAALAPAVGDPQRANYLQWMLYLANSQQPLFRQWFYPGDHLPAAADSIKEAARIGIEAGWSRINAHLATHGPYLLGNPFSAVDLYVLMLMRWSRNMPRPATSWPHLAELAARLKARPSWKQLCDAEGLLEWA